MSLLDKAKSFSKDGYKFSDEEIEIAVAWLKDEITDQQMASAVGKNPLYKLSRWIKFAYSTGKLN